MNKLDLIKKFLPGFLPLFVFIAADEIWGTKIGLIVAIAFGILQFGFIYIREKRLDKFILFDTLLIAALGAVSILLDNDIFFKLKPALIGSILCIILAVSAFTPKNIVFAMSKRYMKGMSISDEQVKQLNQSVKVMFFIFTAHTLLTFYSAFYMSNEAWAFISGGLFYILFGLYFVFEIIKNKYFKKGQKIEWLPIVNEKGEIKGKATREQCHQNKELMHPVVHVHIFNKSKQLYLQKRPENKKIQPGKWDTAVGGHISFGEKIEEGLTREIKEELNITDIDPKLAAKYIWESNVEKELVFMFLASYDKEIKHNTEELEGGKFWTLNNINNNLNKGIFTPNFEKEYHILKKTILKK